MNKFPHRSEPVKAPRTPLNAPDAGMLHRKPDYFAAPGKQLN